MVSGLKQRMAESQSKPLLGLSALRATVAENYPPRHRREVPIQILTHLTEVLVQPEGLQRIRLLRQWFRNSE
jgi:hypothetical protein